MSARAALLLALIAFAIGMRAGGAFEARRSTVAPQEQRTGERWTPTGCRTVERAGIVEVRCDRVERVRARFKGDAPCFDHRLAVCPR